MTLRTICLTTSSPFHCCTFYSLQQWKDLFLMMLPANTDRQHHTDRDHQPKVTGQNIVCRRQPTPHQTVDYIQSNMAVFDQSATRHQDRQPQPELSSDKKLSDTRHTRNNVCHNLEISSLTQFTNPHGINVRLCGEKRQRARKSLLSWFQHKHKTTAIGCLPSPATEQRLPARKMRLRKPSNQRQLTLNPSRGVA